MFSADPKMEVGVFGNQPEAVLKRKQIALLLSFISIIFGTICFKMAEKRERNAWLGFLLGFVFGIFGVIGYGLAGDSQGKKDHSISAANTDFVGFLPQKCEH